MSKLRLFLLAAAVLLLTLLVAGGQPLLAQAPQVHINEIQVSTTGSDWEFVEIQGAPGTDLSSLTLVEVESDNIAAAGTVDLALALSGQIPDDGFWVAMNAAAETAYGVSGDMAVPEGAFENSTATYFLVWDATATAGDDLDTDNDGVLDVTPWAELVDAINLRDADAGDFDYGAPSVGPDGSFLPSGTYRCPNAASGTFAGNLLDFSTPDGTPGTANDCPVQDIGACGEPATLIHEVQGNGDSSPLVGQMVIVEGIVVGDFQPGDGDTFGTDLGGFFLQEESEDMDESAATSEGVFVEAPGASDVVAGEIVRVQGEVEDGDLTQLAIVGDVLACATGTLPEPVDVELPVTTLAELERVEGMLVRFPQALVISEYYNFDRFNEVVLAEPAVSDRPMQPTAYIDPDADVGAAQAAAELITRSRVTLDDGRNSQNPPLLRHPDGTAFASDHIFRGGDLVEGATGTLGHSFGVYRLQPTTVATYTVANERGPAPAVDGEVQVAAFNVLNYFLTLDDGNNDICGPSQDMECRGADTAEEFERQKAKIIAALAAMEADVYGLIEMENTPGVEPLADIVAGLNAELGAGTYAYVDTGVIGTDAIRNGIIYKPATVTPAGTYAVADELAFTDPNDTGTPKNRPALAQTFVYSATDSSFTVVVNHLKSKGSSCGAGDDDPLEGNCNETRRLAADYMMDWLAADPTGAGEGNYLIIGDLNAYDKEDPIEEIVEGPDDTLGTADDYADLLLHYQGEFAYTYLFSGQFGYLDYAMANLQLMPHVREAAVWHINADESDVLDYDMSFKPEEQEALFEANPYRSSDHDPVIVGLFGMQELYLPLIAGGTGG